MKKAYLRHYENLEQLRERVLNDLISVIDTIIPHKKDTIEFMDSWMDSSYNDCSGISKDGNKYEMIMCDNETYSINSLNTMELIQVLEILQENKYVI